jgi:hypothetical protein
MRVFSPAIQGEIDRQYAGEPMVVVEVNWSGNAWVAYTDRKLNGGDYPFPYVVSTSNFDSTQVIDGSGDTQQTTVTMNDIDGTMRSLIDSLETHLRPVRLSLTFQGQALSAKALMFEGVINSPIVWDEGGRTFTFDVLSKLESAEAGFTMEDGDFPYIEPADRNKPWPLVFGQVCNMEAVQLRATRKGFLAEGVGVMDPTISERLCQAYHLKCNISNNEGSADGSINLHGGPGKEEGAGGSPVTVIGDDGEIPQGNRPGGSYTNVRNGKEDEQCRNRRWNKTKSARS